MNDAEYRRMYLAENEHWWYVGLHDLILRHVAREAEGRVGRLAILDAGCGTGRLCELLSRYGRVEGCDISDTAIGFCRERGLTDVRRTDLNSGDLGEGRYDVITAIDVLYHKRIEDEKPVLTSLLTALKPGGLLVLNLVAFELLRSSHDIAVHTRKRYRRSDTVPLLQKCGFRVESAAYRLGFLFFPILCYRLFKRLSVKALEPSTIPSDVFLPRPLINRLLLRLVLLDNGVVARGFGPLGTSLFITARKEA